MPKKKNWLHDLGEILVAFVAAFVFYQLLAFATGTPMPIVSVVSQSMYHSSPSPYASFDQWWNEKSSFYISSGISKQEFKAFPNPNGMSRGDLLLVIKEKPRVGDIVIFQTTTAPYTIVHRVLRINTDGTLETKGDANSGQNSYEHSIPEEKIVGKVIFAVPLLGYPRLALHAVGI
ncbi:MAG: signal peptidase I [Candidatus Aenigmarchaeota archaeon]|nr:signal peptidase I [Candidatus Aenigmarchaeota archaeon]